MSEGDRHIAQLKLHKVLILSNTVNQLIGVSIRQLIGVSIRRLIAYQSMYQMCLLITQEAPIGDVLVLVPADQAIAVAVEVAPLTLHTVVNVFLLSVFDPKLQLVLGHKVVFVAVDFIHDDAAETNTQLHDSSIRQEPQQEPQ